MKFQIQVSDERGVPWMEPYDDAQLKTEEQIAAWAKKTIAHFNSTLRRGELARSFTGLIVIEGEGKGGAHSWVKTNLMTLVDARWGSHDTVECRHCGITGRRYGLDRIQRNGAYRAKKFAFCKPTKVQS